MRSPKATVDHLGLWDTKKPRRLNAELHTLGQEALNPKP